MIRRVELQGVAELRQRIGAMIARGQNMLPLFREISGIMADEVEQNFQAGGRDPQWPESQRVKKHGGQTLIDSTQLVDSIQEFVTATSAGVSTNKAYAGIHNFGGEIKRYPFSSSVRLRTDAKGSLLRQGTEGLKANLAVFAKGGHKRTRSVRFTSQGWTVHMPQREFMKVGKGGIGRIEQAAAKFVTGG